MRRTREVIITAREGEQNRDAGKTFVITEVSAVQAEEWGLRAVMALGTSGFIVPQEMADAGLIGITLVAYQAFMGASEGAVLPLWREMLTACVQLKSPVESSVGIVLMPWSSAIVEEVSTLLTLRQQILELHTGFTMAALVLRLQQVSSAMKGSPTTSTSPGQSQQS